MAILLRPTDSAAYDADSAADVPILLLVMRILLLMLPLMLLLMPIMLPLTLIRLLSLLNRLALGTASNHL